MEFLGSTLELWEEIDRFFMQQSKVYNTLRSLAQCLSAENIDYAVIGGMALVIHGYVRLTQNLDVLLSAEGLEQFCLSVVGKGFIPAFSGATRMFQDPNTGVIVKIIIAGEFPGDGKPKPVSFPAPREASIELEGLNVITLERLIELKLASGLSASDRLKDLADVQELLRVKNLPLELTELLDSSVRSEYIRLWQSVNR